MTFDVTNLNGAHPRTAPERNRIGARLCAKHQPRPGGSIKTRPLQCVCDQDHPHFQLCFRVVSAFASYSATSVYFAVHHPAVSKLIG
jgi:hypothetical protein